jgi:hypothetical protein
LIGLFGTLRFVSVIRFIRIDCSYQKFGLLGSEGLFGFLRILGNNSNNPYHLINLKTLVVLVILIATTTLITPRILVIPLHNSTFPNNSNNHKNRNDPNNSSTNILFLRTVCNLLEFKYNYYVVVGPRVLVSDFSHAAILGVDK